MTSKISAPSTGGTDLDMADREELTLSVPEAASRCFGLGKNAAYAAAARGEIPTIKIGRLLRVPEGRSH